MGKGVEDVADAAKVQRGWRLTSINPIVRVVHGVFPCEFREPRVHRRLRWPPCLTQLWFCIVWYWWRNWPIVTRHIQDIKKLPG